MSPTNVNHRKHNRVAAFTLLELIVSVGLSAIIFAGVLAGYTFLARSFSRQLNTQDQDVKSRRAVYLFSQDINAAIKVANPDDDPTAPLASRKPNLTEKALKLTVRKDPNATKDVVYTIDYDSVTKRGTLTRKEPGKEQVLLTDLIGFDSSDEDHARFRYFNTAGEATTGALSIKEIELKFTSAVGNAAIGTAASYKAASSRLVLRNKALLQ